MVSELTKTSIWSCICPSTHGGDTWNTPPQSSRLQASPQICPPFLPQPQPLLFVAGGIPLAMAEKRRLDHIEERLGAIEGSESYALADLCLVPDITIPPKFKVPDFNKYKGTTCPKNHLKIYYRKMEKKQIIDQCKECRERGSKR